MFQSGSKSLSQSIKNGQHRNMRFFNTAGPMDAQDHYCIPPLERIDLDYVLNLIHGEKYFVLHAPRQTGKTSALKALRDRLNSGAEGDYRCLYVNVETAQAWRENIPGAMEAILDVLAERASSVLGDDSLEGMVREVQAEKSPCTALFEILQRWAQTEMQPVVLLIDEIDALIGDNLLSVLRQLRSGYEDRPDGFPHSIVLCGVRDVRDYRVRSDETGEPVVGVSVFNVSAASLRLGNFDRAEVDALLGQHTSETGQEFEPAAIERVYTQTAGQPWLVNALCNEACFKNPEGRDRSRTITEHDILAAQEVLIQGRVVHLDRLADKLRDDQVQRVIKSLLSGADGHDLSPDDYDYVCDLGLITPGDDIRIANPIYAEVIPRELTCATQKGLRQQPRGT